MLQSLSTEISSETQERMETATENLKRILQDLRPIEHKPKVEEISTAGTWRSWQDSVPQLSAE